MPHTVVDDIAIPNSVQEFCADNGITQDLLTSITLVNEAFGPGRPVTVEMETDPETGEPFIVVEVIANMSVDEALQRNKTYTTRWVQAASAKGRDHIRFLFSIP